MPSLEEENPYAQTRILILEDDRHVRIIVRRLLREIGFRTILEGDNGIDGFRELLLARPDIVLCDIHMKPMGGMTFLRKLRSLGREQFSELPVIFMTSDTQSETVSEALDLRVDGYLTKPISRAALKEKVDAVLFSGV